jgi:hypothetical protein
MILTNQYNDMKKANQDLQLALAHQQQRSTEAESVMKNEGQEYFNSMELRHQQQVADLRHEIKCTKEYADEEYRKLR